jgi:hypothetical protein
LQLIAKLIAAQEDCKITTNTGIEKIKIAWEQIVEYTVADNFYKNFQLSQIEKYIQQIISKARNQTINASGTQQILKKSIIRNNVDAAKGAADKIKKKYADTNS